MSPTVCRVAAIMLSLPCLTFAASAQAISITGVSETGVPGYSPADMQAATGLTPGTHQQDEVQKAADALAASGQFATVGYAMNDGALVFQLTAPDHALPVHFENFVWWSDAELERLVRAKAPLFHGTLGGPGTTLDAMQATLTAMARERAGDSAKVDNGLAGETGKPPVAFRFTITQPPITVARVKLSNDTMEMAAAVTDAARSLPGQPYTRDTFESTLLARLETAYAGAGYYDFALKNLRTTDPMPDNGGFVVTVLADIVPGATYQVGQVHWAATPQLSAEDFSRNTAVKAGDTASQVHADETVRMIERNYQRQGYPHAKATAATTLDRSAHTVSYNFTVEAGDHADQ